MKKKLVVVGNSHLAAFRRCFHQYFSEQKNRITANFVPANLLLYDWRDFERNKHLTHFEFQPQRGALNVVENPQECFLLLVGFGLLGGGFTRPFGDLNTVPRGEENRAQKYSPKIPLIVKKTRFWHLPGDRLPRDKAKARYERYFSRHIVSPLRALQTHSPYKAIHWVAEPEMTCVAARVRFAAKVFTQRRFAVARELGLSVFEEISEKENLSEHVIRHSEDSVDDQGFLRERFFHSRFAHDIHCSPDFFKAAIGRYIALIED